MQRGGDKHIHCTMKEEEACTWVLSSKVGSLRGGLKTSNLKNKGSDWYYYDRSEFHNNDTTIQFVPLSESSCILQTSILLSSTGPTSSIVPDYLGTFTIVEGQFSAGRPVWRNSKGKVLKIISGKTKKEKSERTFGVYDSLTSTSASVRSGSAPTCPTHAKAGYNARTGHGWQFWDGKDWVEDNNIFAE